MDKWMELDGLGIDVIDILGAHNGYLHSESVFVWSSV